MNIDSKLIIIEGLPGSGKSTTAQFIAHQLKRNNISAEWYYEMGLEHPLEFSYEACLDEEENQSFISKYSDYKTILESEFYKRNDKFFYKYLVLQRKYKNQLPIDVIEYLESFDMESKPYYFDMKLEKWKQFTNSIDSADRITVIESSFFQGPIIDLLLKDENKEIIKSYIYKLLHNIIEVKPVLIYFYQNDIETSIKKMLDFRGHEFRKHAINMISKSQYGQNHLIKGIDGVINFFTEYKDIVDELFSEFQISKLAIDNSEANWLSHKMQVLEFLGIEYENNEDVPVEILQKYVGTYVNNELEANIPIKLEYGELFFYFNKSYKEKLIPSKNNSFHIQASTLDIVFLENQIGEIDRFMVSGRPTASLYGEIGIVFRKKEQIL